MASRTVFHIHCDATEAHQRLMEAWQQVHTANLSRPIILPPGQTITWTRSYRLGLRVGRLAAQIARRFA